MLILIFSKSCQRDRPQSRQLAAAFVPAAGEHSENQLTVFDPLG
jgi:hypothetical protein